jgi:hypothetical protein
LAGDSNWIVVLSGNGLNAGLVDVAARRGARLLVVDWNRSPAIGGDRHLRLDIKDSPAVLDAVRPLLGRIAFAYTSSDAGTETAARINAEIGHRRTSRRSLAAARYKPAMNAAWAEAGLLGKRFAVCHEPDGLRAFQAGFGGDLIVKPSGASSSRGVTALGASECEGIALAEAFEKASEVDPRGEVLGEELVHGTEYTIEMLGDSRGGICVFGVSRKHHSSNAGRGRVASKLHYNPADMSRGHRLGLAAFGSRCFRALGLGASLGHLELIERPDGGLVPIEIGARTSGFIGTHLLDAINEPGPTLIGAYETVLRGGNVPDRSPEPKRSAMYFFYDLPPGVGIRSGTSLVDHLPAGIESLAHDRSRLRAGSRFETIDSEFDRPGYEILVGDPERLTIDAVQRAELAHRHDFLEPADVKEAAVVG